MAELKRCCRCKKMKPTSEFAKDKRRKDGLKSFCRECHNKYESEWRKRNPEKFATRNRRYAETHRKQIRNYSRKYRQQDPERYRQYTRDYRIRLKLEVLVHYGGDPPKCACCGENHIEFLTIDHIHGGGKRHRKKIGTNIYNWLKKTKFPDGFRVLCMNCNSALGFYGYCPHQKERGKITT